jgi:phosphosulfolactate synthase
MDLVLRERTDLMLPERRRKPRSQGLTVVIDGGLPVGLFRDAIESAAAYVDIVKFGWGTAAVTTRLAEKTRCLQEHGIDWFLGGTLFEVYLSQGRLGDFVDLCHGLGCRYVEVSNGTIHLPNDEKAGYVSRLAEEFVVLSEVGYKDAERSDGLGADEWIEFIGQDLDAGATLVVTEARESGHSGICDATGALRFDIVERILESGIDCERLLFEAPTKELQTFFITRVGPNVNLANIAALDLIGVETLRLGLRSDTLLHFELERRHRERSSSGA